MNPNSETLFHFTKHKDVFQSILRKGLRYSFAYEEFPSCIVNNIVCCGMSDTIVDENSMAGMAIPMISFCDIPLTRVDNHSNRYGKYAIGIDKSFLSYLYGDFINPVFYIDSKSVQQSIAHLTKAQGVAAKSYIIQSESPNDMNIKAEALDYITKFRESIYQILSICKPTFGVNVEGEKQCFYEEREWRAIYPNLCGTSFEWQIGCTRSEFKEMKELLNNALDSESEAFVTLPTDFLNYINHIIVPKEDDIPEILEYILNSDCIMGHKKIDMNQRLLLLSKLTSYERITSDY